jgi:hypothetical protein
MFKTLFHYEKFIFSSTTLGETPEEEEDRQSTKLHSKWIHGNQAVIGITKRGDLRRIRHPNKT